MHIFEYKGTQYLNIKDHNFQILNGFCHGYQNHIYIQCTTTSSSGIVKEYLPQGWELQKSRYNGQMIFTLYKKSCFAYKSKSTSIGNVAFVALSKEGARYLLHRWILNEQLELDDNQYNINIVEAEISRRIGNLSQVTENQKMFGVSIDMNNWNMKHILSDIEEQIKAIT